MDILGAGSNAENKNRNFIILDRSEPIRSDILFLRGDEVLIQHQGEQYRLRRTRNGKLILTK
jgi:hemin uptake protein HemP